MFDLLPDEWSKAPLRKALGATVGCAVCVGVCIGLLVTFAFHIPYPTSTWEYVSLSLLTLTVAVPAVRSYFLTLSRIDDQEHTTTAQR